MLQRRMQLRMQSGRYFEGMEQFAAEWSIHAKTPLFPAQTRALYERTSVPILSGCFHRHCQAQTPPISLPLGIGITC